MSKKINMQTATREEKLIYFAAAERVNAVPVWPSINPVPKFAPMIRGILVGGFCDTKQEAIAKGRNILSGWQREAVQAGLVEASQ